MQAAHSSISAVGTKVEMRKPWENWWDASFLPCQVTFPFHCTTIVYCFIVKRNHQPKVMFVKDSLHFKERVDRLAGYSKVF